MAFYEFTDEENIVFTGLSLRMNIAVVLMIVVGILLIVVGVVRYPFSMELVLLTANGLLLFGIGYLTFRTAARYKKIVDTQGHDIMYLMEAMTAQSRVYTLIVIIIVVVGVLMALSALLVG